MDTFCFLRNRIPTSRHTSYLSQTMGDPQHPPGLCGKSPRSVLKLPTYTHTHAHTHIEREKCPRTPGHHHRWLTNMTSVRGQAVMRKSAGRKGGKERVTVCSSVKRRKYKSGKKKKTGIKEQWRMGKSHTSPSNILLLMTFSFPHLFPSMCSYQPRNSAELISRRVRGKVQGISGPPDFQL